MKEASSNERSPGREGRPDVSYVVVNWNAGKYLPAFFESLRRESTGFSYELILVDNGSTDGSNRMVKDDFPWVNLVETGRNLGFAGGNNLGIARSRGRLLCLVNPDVVFLPGCMDALIGELERNPSAGIAGPLVLGSDGRIQRSVRPFPSLLGTAAKAFALDGRLPGRYRNISGTVDVEVMNGCFWLIRREALERTGPLDERFFMYSEDADLCRRFHDAGWVVRYVPSSRIVHYGGGSSSLAPVRFYLEMRRANLQYWQKHHSKTEQKIFVTLSVIHQAVRFAAYSIVAVLVPGKAGTALYKRRRSLKAVDWFLTSGSMTDVPVDPAFWETEPAGRGAVQ